LDHNIIVINIVLRCDKINMRRITILVSLLLISTALPCINGSVVKNSNVDEVQNYEFVPGEFIIKLTKDREISSPSIDKLNKKYQVSSLEKVFKNSESPLLDKIYIISIPEDSDILSVVNDYSSCPDINYAEPNFFVHLCGIPNDEDFSKQWNLYNTGQNEGTPDADIDAPEAWDIETGSSDVTIAIIDSGIDYSHPDLADNIWINKNENPNNGVDDDNNGYVDDVMGWDFYNNDNEPLDGFGHGTHCAGIASGVTNNSIGIAGVCWGCKIMTVQSINESGHGTWSTIANGIKYATDNGANIVSMSFGLYTFSNLLKDIVDYAYDKGVFMCASAGNDGLSEKFYPAAFENVVAVAATDNNDSKMIFYYEIWDSWCISNYGEWVDVAAPGEFIYSAMPTYNVWLSDYGFGLNYEYLTGTSMATPHVAGIAALILSKNPSYSPKEVRSIIRSNVDPYSSDVYIGTGRINAYKALIEYNTEPNIPTISGPTNGKKWVEYEYTFSTIDPDGDDVKYFINWGDGNSEWTKYYKSGEEIKVNHTWKRIKTTYIIEVKAKDVNGGESDWAELKVMMPRNKITTNILFLWILEKLPLFKKLILNLK